MDIGNKIKELRKKEGMTQGQLAEHIGVSFQAVSKWETGVALPDIAIIPILANCFGVSIDNLFDYSLEKVEEDVNRFIEKTYKLRETNPKECRKILKDALKKYPDNELLLNNLLYVLDFIKNPDETIEIASTLINKTKQDDIKYDALRFLAYAYKTKGDSKSAEAAIEQIPELYFTKLTEAACVFEGKAKFNAAKKQRWVSLSNIMQVMWKIAECYEEEGEIEKAISELENAIRVMQILGEGRCDDYIEFFNEQLVRLKEKLKK